MSVLLQSEGGEMSFRAEEVRCETHNISGGHDQIKAPPGWVIVDVKVGEPPNVVVLVMIPSDADPK
jgi:hypothetical protein